MRSFICYTLCAHHSILQAVPAFLHASSLPTAKLRQRLAATGQYPPQWNERKHNADAYSRIKGYSVVSINLRCTQLQALHLFSIALSTPTSMGAHPQFLDLQAPNPSRLAHTRRHSTHGAHAYAQGQGLDQFAPQCLTNTIQASGKNYHMGPKMGIIC